MAASTLCVLAAQGPDLTCPPAQEAAGVGTDTICDCHLIAVVSEQISLGRGEKGLLVQKVETSPTPRGSGLGTKECTEVSATP